MDQLENMLRNLLEKLTKVMDLSERNNREICRLKARVFRDEQKQNADVSQFSYNLQRIENIVWMMGGNLGDGSLGDDET